MPIVNPTRDHFGAPPTGVPGAAAENDAELNALIALALDSIGAAPKTAASLDANGLLTATTGRIVVDTFEGAPTDDLERISLDLPEGRIIILSIADGSRTVRLVHQVAGGSADGKLRLLADASRTLIDTIAAVMLQRVGNEWHEIWLGAPGSGGGGISHQQDGEVAITGDTTSTTDHWAFQIRDGVVRYPVQLRLAHGTPSTSFTYTLAKGASVTPKGALFLFYVPAKQTGQVFLAIEDNVGSLAGVQGAPVGLIAGAYYSALVRENAGSAPLVEVSGPLLGIETRLAGPLNLGGRPLRGHLAVTGTRSGMLAAADSGGFFDVTGPVLIPVLSGFFVHLKMTDAFTITFDGAEHGPYAAGTRLAVHVDQSGQLTIDVMTPGEHPDYLTDQNGVLLGGVVWLQGAYAVPQDLWDGSVAAAAAADPGRMFITYETGDAPNSGDIEVFYLGGNGDTRTSSVTISIDASRLLAGDDIIIGTTNRNTDGRAKELTNVTAGAGVTLGMLEIVEDHEFPDPHDSNDRPARSIIGRVPVTSVSASGEADITVTCSGTNAHMAAFLLRARHLGDVVALGVDDSTGRAGISLALTEKDGKRLSATDLTVCLIADVGTSAPVAGPAAFEARTITLSASLSSGFFWTIGASGSGPFAFTTAGSNSNSGAAAAFEAAP